MNVVQLQPKPSHDSFIDFWKLYPRRVARAHARRIWEHLTEDERLVAVAELPNHVKLWRLKGTEIDFIPHPGTWLNGRRFEDELQPKTVAVEKICCSCKRPLTNGHTRTSAGDVCNECYSNR